MTQSLTFVVDSANDQLVDVMATVDGEQTSVKVPALEVHLSSADQMMFPTLRFRSDIDAARELFAPGATIIMTLEAE